MQLQSLIDPKTSLAFSGALDRDITAVCYDSRRVIPGALFVALPGENADGHEFVVAAVARGAVACVVSQNRFLRNKHPSRTTFIRVNDTRRALAELAANFYGRPADQLKMIGVTGTNGKTTTTFMVKHLLESTNTKTGLIGTVRYEIGERSIPAIRTTPQSLDLHDMLAQMTRAGCGACAMEVSSHALDQQRVREIEFDAAVFTNLSQDHLDYHKTMADYFAAKMILFRNLNHQQNRGCAIVNGDDSRSKLALSLLAPSVRRLTFGIESKADVYARRLSLTSAGTKFSLESPFGTAKFSMPFIGRYNVLNALAAISVGASLGLSLEAMADAMAKMRRVPGRLEDVGNGHPFRVFVDYAHSDDALRNVLGTLRELKPRKLILVFGAGGCRDATKRPLMGRAACEGADFSILTSDNPRREEPREILRQIAAGFTSKKKFEVAVDRRQAIERALRLADKGDIVLLAGKGHETVQEYADTVVPFDDREVAREILNSPKGASLHRGAAAWKS